LRKIFILFTSLTLISGCEKAIDFDKLQERNGVFYEVNSETPFTGEKIYKDRNGKKKI
jgi:hypothetical protein